MKRWEGRVAIVTGASAGIGAAIARLLVENNMRVVGVARRDERVEELSAELKKEGAKGELFAIKGDVSNEADVKRVVQWTKEKLGGADVLVNNAGVAPLTPLSSFQTETLRNIFETNVIGLALFTREVVQDMRSRGVDDGHIFHINSVCGQSVVQVPGIYPYMGSKHAVSVMAEGLRRELRDLKTKIRITSISPGMVRTEIAIAGGMSPEAAKELYDSMPSLESKDIADALVYALGAPAHVQVHEITIHPVGETI